MPALRSSQWYSGQDRNAYLHRAWMRRGVPGDAFGGRPQIAIANAASDLAPCNSHLGEEVRAGTLSEEDFLDSESSMIRSRGHCNTMGTASTMAVMAEALGAALPGTAALPAADSRLLAGAQEAGRLAVQLAAEGRRP